MLKLLDFSLYNSSTFRPLTHLHIKLYSAKPFGYLFSTIHISTGLISKISVFFVRLAQCLT
ncbi:hypothetical protein AL544_012445 [Vibrio mimicus]|uniref:Uncharacterized protein n=1 Tax=Vibrio mimicus TaxID=674 RepID=A0A2J9V3V2_VIBMI|nr:hypothetical protein AL544_012445 [Vibrio mimicus]TXY48223.1 hypothetical protein FXE78_00825 [Vibrio mimicus]